MFTREKFNIFQGMADLGFGLAGAFIVMVIILIMVIGQEKDEEEGIKPGSLVVTTTWINGNSDVDTWVSDPFGEVIGYSRKNSAGGLWNLLRDDTGLTSPFDTKNEELLITAGIAPGEYQVNLHLYALRGDRLPMSVHVVVTFFPAKGGKIALYNIHTDLLFVCQEKTVIRFTLDEKGNKVSESYLHQNLRSAQTCSSTNRPYMGGER